jgi:hypothetical protein
MICSAVKKKGSTEQCPLRAIAGHTVCGKHARSKTVVLWADANRGLSEKITRIQARIRGWLVRRRLALAGPGVLCRKNLSNDEDLETCEESSREDPFTYFAFEESGKIWWFSFPTLWKWCIRNPTNPYTKVALSSSTRKRLREIWYYNRRRKIPLPLAPANVEERIRIYWNVIIQTLEDCGFGEIYLNTNFSKNTYNTILRLIRDDIPVTMRNKSARDRVDRHIRAALASTVPLHMYLAQCAYTLMIILMVPKDPYELAFTFLSAMYRA